MHGADARLFDGQTEQTGSRSNSPPGAGLVKELLGVPKTPQQFKGLSLVRSVFFKGFLYGDRFVSLETETKTTWNHLLGVPWTLAMDLSSPCQDPPTGETLTKKRSAGCPCCPFRSCSVRQVEKDSADLASKAFSLLILCTWHSRPSRDDIADGVVLAPTHRQWRRRHLAAPVDPVAEPTGLGSSDTGVHLGPVESHSSEVDEWHRRQKSEGPASSEDHGQVVPSHRRLRECNCQSCVALGSRNTGPGVLKR